MPKLEGAELAVARQVERLAGGVVAVEQRLALFVEAREAVGQPVAADVAAVAGFQRVGLDVPGVPEVAVLGARMRCARRGRRSCGTSARGWCACAGCARHGGAEDARHGRVAEVAVVGHHLEVDAAQERGVSTCVTPRRYCQCLALSLKVGRCASRPCRRRALAQRHGGHVAVDLLATSRLTLSVIPVVGLLAAVHAQRHQRVAVGVIDAGRQALRVSLKGLAVVTTSIEALLTAST